MEILNSSTVLRDGHQILAPRIWSEALGLLGVCLPEQPTRQYSCRTASAAPLKFGVVISAALAWIEELESKWRC